MTIDSNLLFTERQLMIWAIDMVIANTWENGSAIPVPKKWHVERDLAIALHMLGDIPEMEQGKYVQLILRDYTVFRGWSVPVRLVDFLNFRF